MKDDNKELDTTAEMIQDMFWCHILNDGNDLNQYSQVADH